jgi:Transposase, Mutator family
MKGPSDVPPSQARVADVSFSPLFALTRERSISWDQDGRHSQTDHRVVMVTLDGSVLERPSHERGPVSVDLCTQHAGERHPRLERAFPHVSARAASVRTRVRTWRSPVTLVSPDLIRTVTDGIGAEITAWQTRPLDPMYPVVCFDALRVTIRDEATVGSKAVDLALAILPDGTRDILGLWIEQTEGAPFFAFAPEIRRVIYTTDALESVHARLRKIIKPEAMVRAMRRPRSSSGARGAISPVAGGGRFVRGGKPCPSLPCCIRSDLLSAPRKMPRMDAAVPMDAKNAPTGAWKTAQNAVSHSAHAHRRQLALHTKNLTLPVERSPFVSVSPFLCVKPLPQLTPRPPL